jgi:uncharacterized protein YndB with AHSA1/START domain
VSERNSIDLHSDPLSIIGTRVFDAPRDLVFEVWTDPKHLSQWWGPNGFTTTTGHFDMRPGGVWRFVMHGPDGRDYQNLITFEEVARPSVSSTALAGATMWNQSSSDPLSPSKISAARRA